jgi:uncharacterized phiE125 gp8 family phage protein
MFSSVTIVTPPAAEPLTLQEAKDHLRIDGDDENPLVSAYLTAAREWAEDATRRQFSPATLRFALDEFPRCRDCCSSHRRRAQAEFDGHAILIPRPPLISVSSIQYVDAAGVTQTLSVNDYQIDTYSTPGRVAPAFAKSWPIARRQMNAVTITFVAGYASAAGGVPEKTKSLIRLLLAHQYENREPVVVGTIASELPLAVQSLVSLIRWGDYP